MNPHSPINWLAGGLQSLAVRLWARRLLVAQGACVALAALTIGLFIASILVAYMRLPAVCEGAGCDFTALSPAGAKALDGLGISLGYYAAYNAALDIAFAFGYGIIGVTLFWKRSDDLVVLCASMALLTFGATQPDTLRGLAEAYPALDLPVAFVDFVSDVSFFLLFCVFPDGRFVPRWTRWAAAAWTFYQLLDSFFPKVAFSPRNWPWPIDASLFLGLLGSLVVAQIYRYRAVSGQSARQQTKWVVFGFTASIVMFIGVVLIGWIFNLTRPGTPELFYKSMGNAVITLCALLIPLSLGVAILRYRLWDIDLIIKITLIYSALSAVLTAMFAITDTLLQSLFFYLTGVEQSRVATLASVIVIAVGFQPLRNRIERGVNKLLDRLAGGDRTSEALR